MLTICCVYTFRLSDSILLTAFDALMISLVSRVSWFVLSLFTLELAALFHHSWNSPGPQLLTSAFQRVVEYRKFFILFFLTEFEKRRLSFASHQSNASHHAHLLNPLKILSVEFMLVS